MTPKTFDQTLRTFQSRQPFAPFTVALSNGDRIRVKQPEYLIFRNGTAAYFPSDRELCIFDYDGVIEITGRRRSNRN